MLQTGGIDAITYFWNWITTAAALKISPCPKAPIRA